MDFPWLVQVFRVSSTSFWSKGILMQLPFIKQDFVRQFNMRYRALIISRFCVRWRHAYIRCLIVISRPKAIEKSYPLMIEPWLQSVLICKMPKIRTSLSRIMEGSISRSNRPGEAHIDLKIQMLQDKYGLYPWVKIRSLKSLYLSLKNEKHAPTGQHMHCVKARCVRVFHLWLLLSNTARILFQRNRQPCKNISVLLRDLLWLCIHQMDAIQSYLQGLGQKKSTNPDVLFVARLMGKDANDIVRFRGRSILRRILMSCWWKNALYEQQSFLQQNKSFCEWG